MAEHTVGTGRMDSTREAIADRLHGAASTIRDRANAGSEAITGRAESVAGALESSASYIESLDARRVMRDLFSVIKKHPTQSLLVAGFIGYLLARAFRSDRD